METYEAQGMVSEIHRLLVKAADNKATQDDLNKLLVWEDRAARMLADPEVVADLKIITNEHNCNGHVDAQDGFVPTTDTEKAECERYAREVLGTEGANHLADPRHFRLESIERIGVHEQYKIIDDGNLRKVPVKIYEAVSVPYFRTDGRPCRDSVRSGPEGFVDDKQYGASSALLARLLEHKGA